MSPACRSTTIGTPGRTPLGWVLGVVRIASQPIGEAVDARGVLSHDLFPGGRLPRRRLSRVVQVGLAHRALLGPWTDGYAARSGRHLLGPDLFHTRSRLSLIHI